LSGEGQAAIAKLEKRKQQGITTILYMGGIGPERPLEPILEAIADKKEYRLVVMGRQSGYLQKLQSKYPGQFDYLGAFRPPEHIQIASHADIGLLMYVSVNQNLGLNALFCAPNKLYEYTGQGLPVIANDIPGLRFPVETNQIGVVVDFSKKEAICQALEKIGRDYRGFAARAKVFYNQLDVNAIIFKILEQLQSSEK
jgi:glycosyltransferase involved in cell wall biosynthesis